MTDPLKNKFKYFTFKLYDPIKRHERDHFDELFKRFLEHPDVTVCDYWMDYCHHVGIHANGVFRSTSYKNISATFSQRETKIKGLYLYFNDIPTFKDYNKWLYYCFYRQTTNFHRYLPREVKDRGNTMVSPPLSPMVSCRSNNDTNSNIQVTF